MSNIVFASPAGAFIAPSKGDMKNRANCSVAHMKNNLSAIGATALTVGTGAGLVYGTKIAPQFNNKITKAVVDITTNYSKNFDKLIERTINNIPTKGTLANYVKVDTAALISKLLPTWGKVAAAVAPLVLGTLAFIVTPNFFYKKGQIDQKYTDIAAQQKAQAAQNQE